MVRSWMKLGRSVTASAASRASSRAATFSSYWVSPLVQSMVWTCQPYAAYRAAVSSLRAMLVSSSIEIWLLS